MIIYVSDFGNDIREITDYLNKHGYYPDNAAVVSYMWQKFSDNCYCAGWLGINEKLLEEFLTYISKQFMNTYLVRKV